MTINYICYQDVQWHVTSVVHAERHLQKHKYPSNFLNVVSVLSGLFIFFLL